MIRGFFAIGIFGPKTQANVGTLWRSAACFGASFMFTIGHRYKTQPSDTTKAWKHIPFYEYRDFESFFASLPKETLLLGIEQAENAAKLPTVNHPERAIYLLGAEDYGLPVEILTQCHRILEIPSSRCLNVAVAGSIVMYDRVMRGTSAVKYAKTEAEVKA